MMSLLDGCTCTGRLHAAEVGMAHGMCEYVCACALTFSFLVSKNRGKNTLAFAPEVVKLR